MIQAVWPKKRNLCSIKGGLISERFSPWSVPQKIVPNHYLQLCHIRLKVEDSDLALFFEKATNLGKVPFFCPHNKLEFML